MTSTDRASTPSEPGDPATRLLLWTDQRAWEQPRLDALWRLYRRLARGLVRLLWRGSPQTITTQEIPIDEAAAARAAASLAEGWYEGLGLDYHSLSLGHLLRDKVGGYNVHLHGLCRHACKARALLDTYTPGRVVLVEPALLPAGAFLEALARPRGVRVSALLPGPLRRLGRWLVNRLFYAIGYERHEVALFGVQAPSPTPTAASPPALPLPNLGEEGGQGEGEGTIVVLFVASMNNYLNPMLPVMRALRERGPVVVTIVPRAAQGWGNYAALQQASTILFAEDLVDADLAAEIAARRREYRRLFHEQRDMLRARLRLDDGLDLWPFAAPGMRVVFHDLLPHAVGYVGLAERAYRRFQPGAVVIARQRRAFEHAFVAVARQQNIPVAMLIHGHVSAHPLSHFVGGRFDECDLICAWGQAQRQVLIDQGAPPQRVLATGNPQWDRLAPALSALPPAAECRQQVAEQLRLPAGAFWVTFTSHAAIRSFLPPILDAVRRRPGAVLVVKVHPGEQVDDYERALSESDRERCRVVKQIDLHTLLRASDVVLTYVSTTNLEALAVGVPLCVVNFIRHIELVEAMDFPAYGVPEAHDSAELERVLARLQEEPTWGEAILRAGRRALDDYAHGLDGRATARVTDAILSLAQGTDQPV